MFVYTNTRGQTYYLHGKTVLLQNGRPQAIYYFAPTRCPETLAELPDGHRVVENKRTGLPYLKRGAD